jgi:excisionase family DNA binding protein
VTDDILEAEEVAEMLRVHPRTIMRLASQGKIPGFKVGGQWRFRREAINQYIREQEQQHGGQKKNKELPSDGSDMPLVESDDLDRVDTS